MTKARNMSTSPYNSPYWPVLKGGGRIKNFVLDAKQHFLLLVVFCTIRDTHGANISSPRPDPPSRSIYPPPPAPRLSVLLLLDRDPSVRQDGYVRHGLHEVGEATARESPRHGV